MQIRVIFFLGGQTLQQEKQEKAKSESKLRLFLNPFYLTLST